MKTFRLTMLAVALTALVVACSNGDDGAGVREIDGSSGSASGSASGSGSSSGSASGSASATVKCEPVGDKASADTTVNVELSEWTIEASPKTAPAGKVAFVAENVGIEAHELVVVKGVPVGDLPLDENGALDEEQLPAGALIGEIEAFPAGETCDGTFTLAAGEYTLVCNITETEDNGEKESHLHEGMATSFTVT